MNQNVLSWSDAKGIDLPFPDGLKMIHLIELSSDLDLEHYLQSL